MLRFGFLLLLPVLAVSVPAAPEPVSTAPDMAVVERWVKRSAGLKTVVADFRQERKLVTMRKPLESTGRLWFSVERSAFRLQSGDPPKFVAVLRADVGLTILHPEKKEAEVISMEALTRSEMGQALQFLTAGFPKSMEALREQFEVMSVAAEQGWHQIELKPAGYDGNAPVRRLVVQVDARTGTPGAVHLMLRDGSRVSNTFTKVEENPAIPEAQFTADLTGYAVKRK